jgi:ectoine hydroxylase-related dioxygenase (phytanoyl-CoA dioxygenase family)
MHKGTTGAATVVDADVIDRFADLGHAVVRGLASPEEIEQIRPLIDQATDALRWDRRSLAERDTYGKAFIQAANVHRHDPAIAAFLLSRRFAAVAAALLGCDGVRLYHDQALYKEPGGGHTPWHQDQVYWPVDTDQTVTMWMPLVDIPGEVGGMRFVDRSWQRGDLGGLEIGDASEEYFSALIEREGLECTSYAPLGAGDATFHRGWTLHSAPANSSELLRAVVTVIYVADGASVATQIEPKQVLDHQLWLGGATPGSLIDGEANPVLWRRDQRAKTPLRR